MWFKLILFSFLFEGLFWTSEKVVGELGLGKLRNNFIFVYNLFAAIIGILFLIKVRKRPRKEDIFLGGLIGLMFCGAAFFCMQAVLELPGIIYFPIASVGGIVWVTFLSHVIWREKLRRTQVWGLLVACSSLILLTT